MIFEKNEDVGGTWLENTRAEQLIPAVAEVAGELFTEYFRAEFPDPELFEKVLPTYPPTAKRIVRNNGIIAVPEFPTGS